MMVSLFMGQVWVNMKRHFSLHMYMPLASNSNSSEQWLVNCLAVEPLSIVDTSAILLIYPTIHNNTDRSKLLCIRDSGGSRKTRLGGPMCGAERRRKFLANY